MSSISVSGTFARLRQSALERWDPQRASRTRVAVQVGHCSLSVGAAEIARLLEPALPQDAYLVISGCDGACFDAPQVLVTDPSGAQRRYTRVTADSVSRISEDISNGLGTDGGDESGFFVGQHRLTLDLCGMLDGTDIDDFIVHGGYTGLARSLDMSPEEVIEEVKASGLRGRGGAYFSAAIKWQGARSVENTPRYLVVNSEEGEPEFSRTGTSWRVYLTGSWRAR